MITSFFALVQSHNFLILGVMKLTDALCDILCPGSLAVWPEHKLAEVCNGCEELP
jgi:hypothetical protein